MTPCSFHIASVDGAARTGRLTLSHGTVHTPVLLPVGSQGTVKGIVPSLLEELEVEMLLANSYHLTLRPGLELLERCGGLHRFMGWKRPILTDSGGFQVFSLASLGKVSDAGVQFRSHIDGSPHFLSPESAVKAQERIGSDIAMVLDQFPAWPCTREEAEAAVKRTILWADRGLEAHSRPDQALFAIVQGSVWPELRRRCAEALIKRPFPGYAIGGVSVGEDRSYRKEEVASCCEVLPVDKPRYVMGVGEPEDLLPAVACGVDLFDCVIPTRCGRNGRLYTWEGTVNIRNSRFRDQFSPLEEDCPCYACRHTSAAYLHHLFQRNEMLGPVLATLHNIAFFQRLFEAIRSAIERQEFMRFHDSFLAAFTAGRGTGGASE